MSRLDEIRERWEKATPGPWKASDFGYAGMEEPCSIVIHTGKFDWQDINGEGESVVASMLWDRQEADNADAIANAREDVPFLLAEVKRLNFLYGTTIPGIRCTCECVDPGDHISPPAYEQDPWCPQHPDMNAIRQEFARVESERDAIQETARRNLVTIEKILDAPMFKHVKPHIMEAIEKGAR